MPGSTCTNCLQSDAYCSHDLPTRHKVNQPHAMYKRRALLALLTIEKRNATGRVRAIALAFYVLAFRKLNNEPSYRYIEILERRIRNLEQSIDQVITSMTDIVSIL